MSTERDWRTSSAADASHEEEPALVPGKHSGTEFIGRGTAGPKSNVPGKRTLAEGLPATAGSIEAMLDSLGGAGNIGAAVQRRSIGGPPPGAALAKKVAGDGLAGASSSLPHLETIQRAFGRHDVSGVRAQVGGPAQQASDAIGASAYAQGDRVGFGAAPDLHTAAHEAAHIVQQRSGRTPAGGLDTPGDSLEQHADAVADTVVSGGSAEALLDAMTAGGGAAATSQAVQRKEAEKPAPRSDAETRKLLERYFYDNSTHVWGAVGDHMRSIQLATPDERLTWVNHQSFVIKLLMQLETALGKFNPIAPLDEILHPTDVVRAFGGMVPQTIGWYPEIGIAVAQALHLAVVSSIKRLAPRYLEAADSRGASGTDIVRWDELITSKPIDRYIAVALCWPHSVTVHALDAKAAKAAKGKKTELRSLKKYELVGEKDQSLWNWIRVEPADASPEEVAAEIFHVSDDHGDKSASFNAYLLTPAPPLYGVPKHLAIKNPLFKRVAPQNVSLDGDNVNAQLMRVVNSDAADEVAIGPQTGPQPKSQTRPEIGQVLDTLRDCEMQLQAITDQLVPWKLSGRTGGVAAFLKRRETDINSADQDRLSQWSRVLEAQKVRLSQIGGLIVSVAGAAAKLGAKPGDPQSAPMLEILELLAVAAGTSHVAAASEQKLAEAMQLQATLSVRALQSTEQDMMGSLATAQQQTGDTKRVGAISHEAVALEDQSRAMQARMLNGEDIDTDQLEDVSLKSEENATESRLYSTLHTLGELNHQSIDASKGDAAIIASMFSGAFRDLPSLTKRIFDELSPAHSTLMSMRQNVEQELDSGRGSPKRRAELREQRRQILANVKERYAKLSKDRDLEHFFQNAAKLIENQQFRTACVQVAVMIGISIVAGAAAGVAARAVGGILMEASGASTVAELGYAARAGIAITRIGVDTTISAAGTSAVQGTSFTEAWKENLIISLGTSAVFGSISRYAAEQAQLEGRIAKTWSQVGKLGKLGMVAKEVGSISAHTLWGAAMGSVADRIVTGKAAPPPATLREWALQGISVAVGKHVSTRLTANSEMFKAIEESAEDRGRSLTKAAAKLQEMAKRVISGKQPDLTLELLNEHDQFLRKEIDAIDRAIAKKGDPTGELGAARQNLVAAAEVAGSLGMTETKFTIIGMEELIPGELWKGSREQIEQALAQAKQDGQNPKVLSREHGQWKVNIGSREYVIQETVSSAKTVDAERVMLAGTDERLRLAAKLVPPQAGSLDVFVHGTVDDFIVFRDGKEIHLPPRQVAEYIKSQGLEFKKIRLLACSSGVHPKGAAQHLANKLGVPVEAPTDKVWIHPDGSLTIGPAASRNTGKWIEYTPQPSETRWSKAPEVDTEQGPATEKDVPSRAIDLGGSKPPPSSAKQGAAPPPVHIEEAERLTPSNVEDVIKKIEKQPGGRQLRDDEKAAIRRQANNKGEKWNFNDFLRGEVAHALADENLPRSFETIDRAVGRDALGNAEEITSIKSHQLYSDKFAAGGKLLTTLTGEIDVLAKFKRGVREGVAVRRGPNTRMYLEVEVPPGALSKQPVDPAHLTQMEQRRAEWVKEVHAAEAHAESVGVILVLRETKPAP